MMFSSANSINWGRLLPQVVYYVSAYCDMVNLKKINLGDKINIVVPTGNFGNILAAYYASEMGIPVNKFICASNSNNVLTDFINTGVYDKNRDFYTTISPSMDILVSSNLERLLYKISDNDDKLVSELMSKLKTQGVYEVPQEIKTKISDAFYGGFCDEVNTKQTIKNLFDAQDYLCDTHTAVAVSVYDEYVKATNDKTPSVIVSTASPYKFSKSVLQALSNEALPESEFDMVDMLHAISKMAVPTPIAELKGLKSRFSNVTEKENMKETVLKALGIN